MKEATLTRRSFVKTAAVAGAAVAMSSALAGCLQESGGGGDGGGEAPVASERSFYVTICHGCIQACPCKVYLENGVVVKIEGHPDAPVNLGSLCLKGLNQIHTCYSPRRVLYPLRRTGARGVAGATFERISWDEAIDLASSKIAEAMEKYGTYSFFTSTGGGGGYSFVQTLMMPQSLCSPTVFEPGCAQCYLPRQATAPYMYGGSDQSIADCAVLEPFKGLSKIEQDKGITSDTRVMVIWGAQPSVSQTAQSGRGMAELRALGCKTIVVDPNFSPDAVKATIHLPVRPGSDAALILSWIRVILDETLYDVEFTKYFTNVPFLINPETKLPWLATDAIDGYTPPADMPANTPVYICVDENSGEVVPLPFGDPAVISQTVNPQVLATATVKGLSSRSVGQIYRDEAEPWTLEKAEEFCWVPKDRIRAAIDLYTGPYKEGKCAGIGHGVATDMEENASQIPLGLLAMDMMMGYVNKPGATLTQNGGGGFFGGPAVELTATNKWGKCAPDGVLARPTTTTGFGGIVGSMYGCHYIIGATEEENQARADAVPEVFDPSVEGAAPFLTKGWQWAYNQLLLDRIGMKRHRGLYDWCHSHIPAVREAIETGEPFRPRVWFDTSGNKFAVLGSAGAWYNAIMNGEIDFIICQYPMITSFQIEMADLIFPLEEWLEATGANMGQLNYQFPTPGIIHLGETVPNTVPPKRVIDAVAAKLNPKLDQITFGGTGQTIADLGLQFPTGIGVMMGTDDEAVTWASQIAQYGPTAGIAPDATKEEYLEAAKNNPDVYIVNPPSDIYWTYGQHLVIANDGLPVGFGTESRKCEVYCTTILKMGRTGFPYCFPRTADPIDSRIGTNGGDYSPICNVPVQKEAPEVANSGDYIMPFDPDFPLALTSGRLYYFHHGTMRHAPYTRELYPVPYVRINPKTAAEYGIADGDWVEISSRRTQGSDYTPGTGLEASYNKVKEQNTKTAEPIRTIAYVAEVVAPNVLWMERFWNPECFDSTQATKTGGWQESNVNVITNAVDAIFNEVFGSYTNRGFAVNIKKSTRPERVWVEPKQFQPFMPTNKNEYLPDDIGIAIENKDLLTDIVAFAPAGMEGGQ